MIFSVSYRSKYKQEAGEIRCPYNQLGLIFDFIKSNPDKRINITCGDLSSEELQKMIEQIEFVKEVAQDYTIECGNIRIYNSLQNNEYKAYLRFPITDWETFQNLRNSGSSDIYIDGPLGFQCDAIKDGKEDIKIRVSPTITSSGALADRSVNSFFIRPEDLKLYEGVIDVIDFKVQDQEKEDALFSIYSRKEFHYPIDQLISGLPSINNIFFKNDFASNRLNCQQKCMIPGRHCHYCESYFLTTKKMFELVTRPD